MTKPAQSADGEAVAVERPFTKRYGVSISTPGPHATFTHLPDAPDFDDIDAAIKWCVKKLAGKSERLVVLEERPDGWHPVRIVFNGAAHDLSR